MTLISLRGARNTFFLMSGRFWHGRCFSLRSHSEGGFQDDQIRIRFLVPSPSPLVRESDEPPPPGAVHFFWASFSTRCKAIFHALRAVNVGLETACLIDIHGCEGGADLTLVVPDEHGWLIRKSSTPGD